MLAVESVICPRPYPRSSMAHDPPVPVFASQLPADVLARLHFMFQAISQ